MDRIIELKGRIVCWPHSRSHSRRCCLLSKVRNGCWANPIDPHKRPQKSAQQLTLSLSFLQLCIDRNVLGLSGNQISRMLRYLGDIVMA